jgi:hypothetical protein
MLDPFPYSDGKFAVAPGFNVLSGTELTIAEGADIIVIGPLDALAWFDQQFEPRLSQGFFPTLETVVGPARSAGLVLIGAHPTREGKVLVDLGVEALASLDALEVNGKDMASLPVHAEIEEWAAKANLPVVGSSDAHLWPQVGVQRTLLADDVLTQGGLRAALAKRETRPEPRLRAHGIVHMCQRHKRIIKARIAARQQSRSHRRARHSRRLVIAGTKI